MIFLNTILITKTTAKSHERSLNAQIERIVNLFLLNKKSPPRVNKFNYFSTPLIRKSKMRIVFLKLLFYIVYITYYFKNTLRSYIKKEIKK